MTWTPWEETRRRGFEVWGAGSYDPATELVIRGDRSQVHLLHLTGVTQALLHCYTSAPAVLHQYTSTVTLLHQHYPTPVYTMVQNQCHQSFAPAAAATTCTSTRISVFKCNQYHHSDSTRPRLRQINKVDSSESLALISISPFWQHQNYSTSTRISQYHHSDSTRPRLQPTSKVDPSKSLVSKILQANQLKMSSCSIGWNLKLADLPFALSIHRDDNSNEQVAVFQSKWVQKYTRTLVF